MEDNRRVQYKKYRYVFRNIVESFVPLNFYILKIWISYDLEISSSIIDLYNLFFIVYKISRRIFYNFFWKSNCVSEYKTRLKIFR